MLLKKKATIELDLLMLLLLISVILISAIIILYPVSSNMIEIDEKGLKTQIAIKKLFTHGCFFDDDISIRKSDFTSDRLNDCFANIDDADKKTLFRIKLMGSGEYIYAGDKDEFENKITLCQFSKKNTLCSRMIYPITVIENGKYTEEKLTLEVITS